MSNINNLLALDTSPSVTTSMKADSESHGADIDELNSEAIHKLPKPCGDEPINLFMTRNKMAAVRHVMLLQLRTYLAKLRVYPSKENKCICGSKYKYKHCHFDKFEGNIKSTRMTRSYTDSEIKELVSIINLKTPITRFIKQLDDGFLQQCLDVDVTGHDVKELLNTYYQPMNGGWYMWRRG